MVESGDAVGGHQQQEHRQLHKDRAPCHGRAGVLNPNRLSEELSRKGLPRRELNLRFSRERQRLSMRQIAWSVPRWMLRTESGSEIHASEGSGSKLCTTPVTAVTERSAHIGDTPFVNMVRRARKKVLFEPGDTRQQWKGEAAASFVCTGITSSRVLPTSSAGYWSPFLSCEIQAPPKRSDPSEAIFCLKTYSFGLLTAFQLHDTLKPSPCTVTPTLPSKAISYAVARCCSCAAQAAR